MTLQANFFQTTVSPLVDARDERRRTRALTQGNGVANTADFKVTAVVGSLAVDVAACAEGGGLAWAPGRFSHRGSYFVYSDAVVRVTLNPADATQARTDLIVITLHDGEYEGDSTFTFQLDKVTGTPGGGVPVTTGDMYVLAQVAVPANATGPGTVTDKREQLGPGGSPNPYAKRTNSASIPANSDAGAAPPALAGYWTLTTSGLITINRAGLYAAGLFVQRTGATTDQRGRLTWGAVDLMTVSSGAGGVSRGYVQWINRAVPGDTITYLATNLTGSSITVAINSYLTLLGN